MVDRSSGPGSCTKITMAGTTPTGAMGATRQGMAFSASAAVRRSSSVRRRLDLDDDGGISPKARRVGAYATPPDVPVAPTMTLEQLTQELMTKKICSR